jgi:hypothetical protein
MSCQMSAVRCVPTTVFIRQRGGERSLSAEVIEAAPFLIAAAISTVKRNVKQGADHANTESEQGLSALGCSGDHAIDDKEPSWVDAQRGD